MLRLFFTLLLVLTFTACDKKSSKSESSSSPDTSVEKGAEATATKIEKEVPLEYQILTGGLVKDAQDANVLSLKGNIYFNSSIDFEKVKGILYASLEGKEMPIEWTELDNANTYAFVVKDIRSTNKEQTLNLKWMRPNDQSKLFTEPVFIAAQSKTTTMPIEIIEKKIETKKLEVLKILNFELDSDQNIKIKFSHKLNDENEYFSLIELDGMRIAQITRNEDTLTVVPQSHMFSDQLLTIHKVIKGFQGQTLARTYTRTIKFEKRKPSIKFTGKGVILPHSKHLEVPIVATNVKSVHLRAFKIYKNKVSQFLQENRLKGSYHIGDVGRYLWDKKITLKDAKKNSINNYSLDVTNLLKTEDGSLIRLMVYIDRDDSLYECSEAENAVPVAKMPKPKNLDTEDASESSGWDGAGKNYKYEDKSNPCKDTYFQKNSDASDIKNLLKSNLGIIAKVDSENDNIYVAVSELETSKSISNAKVHIYNFQNQQIGTGITDSDGLAKTRLNGVPFYMRVEKGKEIGYLKLSSGLAISTSQFDVSGVHIKQKLNGFIYGERDVWRPGDKIFLTFVLDQKGEKLPENYPVKMELFNVDGELILSKMNTNPSGSMYAFEFATYESSRTGKWKVVAHVGNQTFSKNLNIETIVPNRLKVTLDVNKKVLKEGDKDLKADLFSQWLHGAKAESLVAEVSVKIKAKKTRLGRFEDYIFDDLTREFDSDEQEVFSGHLDKDGKANFPININIHGEPSGMLKATFTSKVYEQSGAFSANSQSFTYHPYNQYVGLKLPKGDAARGMILTDIDHDIKVAVLSPEGEPLKDEMVDYTFHKISWRWWWDKAEESLAKYASSSSYDLLDSGSVKTDKLGQAKWKLRVNYPDWGRYLVRACSRQSNHCSSKIVYIDWPGWAGRAVEQNTNGVARLSLASDKAQYTVDETAIISLPKSKNSRLLVSLENGTDVIKQFWIDSSQSKLEIPITKEMVPNTYLTVSLIQPHKDRENDRPIRLMGILNIMVDNPDTHLTPKLALPDEVKPASTFEIKVSEDKGRAMNYSLVIVDEGLLGLTNFQTPSLHNYFYKREALQVKTWDLYDEVVGAYSGELEKMLDVGGSDSAKEEERNKKRRFKPVVQYLGTFTLKANEEKIHKVTLPQYIGAVRVMLVAAKDQNYGKADKEILVRSPISLIATLPRVLNVNEEVSLPVDVFVMKDGIKDVKVSVEVEDKYFEVLEGSKTLTFKGQGEEIGQLKLKTKSALGKAKVIVTAQSGKEKSVKIIYIDISSVNPKTFTSVAKRLNKGETWDVYFNPHGLSGTNTSMLELSTVPPLNLENRLNSLIQYPHGCIEQTTSSVFPQLYLSQMMTLSKQRQQEIQKNVDAAIQRLRSFQVNGGGFSYWPGQHDAHPWGTNYASHFLLEAKKKGYNVPSEMFSSLISYQNTEARKVIDSTGEFTKTQAYRLYILSLAKKENMSAMYRLKEDTSIDNISRWLLAASYANIGQKSVAQELSKSVALDEIKDMANDKTFASNLREKALMLMCASILHKGVVADELALKISTKLSSKDWLNTQAISFSLLAMSSYAQNSSGASLSYKQDSSSSEDITFDKAINISKINLLKKGSYFTFTNDSDKPLNVLLGNTGISPAGEEKDVQGDLALDITYTDMDSNPIDVSKLKQGSNFIAYIAVRNTTNQDLENLVLSYVIPSGWQIHNERLTGASMPSGMDYQDIRDDRVYTYLPLHAHSKTTIEVKLNASFEGSFYLPATVIEAMYDAKLNAVKKGKKVEVYK